MYVGDDVEATLRINVSGDSVLIAGRGLHTRADEPTPLPDRFDVEDHGVVFTAMLPTI